MTNEETPAPETLKLQRKKYPPGIVVLGVVVVLAAIAFAVYTIYQATLPPELPPPLPPR